MNAVTQTPAQPKPKLLDRVRDAIRTRHYSRKTEKAYVGWIKRFIFFHGVRHPAPPPSTQNQALSALLFLYKEVLAQPLPWLDNIAAAKRPVRLPVVLSREEVHAILARLHGTPRLMGTLLYGGGLRVLECPPLRLSRMLRIRIRPGRSKGSRCKAARDVRREAYCGCTSQRRTSAPTPQMGLFQRPGKDVDFAAKEIIVRNRKDDKDRGTLLPLVAASDLARHLAAVHLQHQRDLERGAGWVELPGALGRKYPNAGREWGWQWVFPATRFYRDPETGQRRRHHLHESVLQRAVQEAVRRAGVAKQATPHTLRHSFATHLRRHRPAIPYHPGRCHDQRRVPHHIAHRGSDSGHGRRVHGLHRLGSGAHGQCLCCSGLHGGHRASPAGYDPRLGRDHAHQRLGLPSAQVRGCRLPVLRGLLHVA